MKRSLQDERLLGLLPLTVRYRPYEKATALVRRLAARRGSPTVNAFLADMRHFPYFTFNAFAAGDKLDVLARMSGFPEEAIRRYTPIRTDGGFVVGGVCLERAGRLMPAASNGRHCPECLTEDLDRNEGPIECRASRRFWWDLEEVVGCPVHRTPLISSCPDCGRPARMVNLRPDRCACGSDLSRHPARDRVDGLDAVIVGAMLGGPRPDWSTGLCIRTMAAVAVRVGILAELGPRRMTLRSLPPQDRMRLAASGARILAAGTGELTRTLDRAAALGDARTPGQLFGELWTWLDRNDEGSLAPLRGLLIGFASEALRNTAEVELWGSRIPPRGERLAAAAAGQREEQAGDGSRGVQRTGRLEDLAELMGVSIPQLHRRSGGAAVEILPGAVRGRPTTYRYDLGGLTDLLRRASDTPLFDAVPSEMVEVMRVKVLRRRWADVYRALREGRLGVAGRLRGKAGLPSLLVLRHEVCGSCPVDDPEGSEASVTRAEAAASLGVNGKTVTALVKAQALRHDQRRSASGPIVRGPTVSSIEELRRKMLTAREIGALVGRSVQRIRRELSMVGVSSLVPESRGVQPCYDRKEALRAYGLPPFDRVEGDARLVDAEAEPPAPAMSYEEAARRLDVTRLTITALRRARLLAFALRRNRIGGMVAGPTVESVDRFEREYVTAVEIARASGTKIKVVISKLRKAGFNSLVEQRQGVQACYRRAEVLPHLEQLLGKAN